MATGFQRPGLVHLRSGQHVCRTPGTAQKDPGEPSFEKHKQCQGDQDHHHMKKGHNQGRVLLIERFQDLVGDIIWPIHEDDDPNHRTDQGNSVCKKMV